MKPPKRLTSQQMTSAEVALFQRLEEVATAQYDGHLTIMRFTTNWRISFDTAHDLGEYGVRTFIDEMPVGQTFSEVARAALADHEAGGVKKREAAALLEAG